MKQAASFVAAFAVLLTLGACAGGSSSGTERIRMSYQGNGCDLTSLLAQERGFYAKHGLDVELIKFNSTNESSDALLAGRIDISGCIATPVAFAVEASQPGTFRTIRSMAATPEHPNLWLAAAKDDASIQDFKDLAGKRVGVFPGSTTTALLRYVLKQVGVDPKTVTIRELALPQLVTALASGAVDAIYAPEPTPTVAVVQGVGRKVVHPESYFPNPRYNTVYITLKSYKREHEDVVARVIAAQDEAVAYIRANKEDSWKVLAKYSPFGEDVLQGADSDFPLLSTEPVDVAKLQEYADILLREGGIEGTVDASALLRD